jgi:hypothetical protein
MNTVTLTSPSVPGKTRFWARLSGPYREKHLAKLLLEATTGALWLNQIYRLNRFVESAPLNVLMRHSETLQAIYDAVISNKGDPRSPHRPLATYGKNILNARLASFSLPAQTSTRGEEAKIPSVTQGTSSSKPSKPVPISIVIVPVAPSQPSVPQTTSATPSAPGAATFTLAPVTPVEVVDMSKAFEFVPSLASLANLTGVGSFLKELGIGATADPTQTGKLRDLAILLACAAVKASPDDPFNSAFAQMVSTLPLEALAPLRILANTAREFKILDEEIVKFPRTVKYVDLGAQFLYSIPGWDSNNYEERLRRAREIVFSVEFSFGEKDAKYEILPITIGFLKRLDYLPLVRELLQKQPRGATAQNLATNISLKELAQLLELINPSLAAKGLRIRIAPKIFTSIIAFADKYEGLRKELGDCLVVNPFPAYTGRNNRFPGAESSEGYQYEQCGYYYTYDNLEVNKPNKPMKDQIDINQEIPLESLITYGTFDVINLSRPLSISLNPMRVDDRYYDKIGYFLEIVKINKA